jgi:hypothetical protein
MEATVFADIIELLFATPKDDAPVNKLRNKMF